MDEADLSMRPIGQLCFFLARSHCEEHGWLASGIFLQSAEGRREEGVKQEGPRLSLWPQQKDASARESLTPLWLNSVQIALEGGSWQYLPTVLPELCQGPLYPVLTGLAARSLFSVAPCALDLYLPFWIVFYCFLLLPLPPPSFLIFVRRQ